MDDVHPTIEQPTLMWLMKTPNKEFVSFVASKSGLKEQTVLELFEAGWAYQEELDKPPVWIHPSRKRVV